MAGLGAVEPGKSKRGHKSLSPLPPGNKDDFIQNNIISLYDKDALQHACYNLKLSYPNTGSHFEHMMDR